jgi:hypothetical protein
MWLVAAITLMFGFAAAVGIDETLQLLTIS